MSLNNQATLLSEVGRRDEALAAIEEAVALRRRLAEASPAAFLADLAMSLNNQAKFLAEVGRREEALANWDGAVAAFSGRPGVQAELLAWRSAWRLAHDDPDGAASDVALLASLQPPGDADVPSMAGLAAEPGRWRRPCRPPCRQGYPPPGRSPPSCPRSCSWSMPGLG